MQTTQTETNWPSAFMPARTTVFLERRIARALLAAAITTSRRRLCTPMPCPDAFPGEA